MLSIAESQLVPEDKTASIIGLKPQTLRARRSAGKPLLSYVQVGRRIMYRARAIQDFINGNTVEVPVNSHRRSNHSRPQAAAKPAPGR